MIVHPVARFAAQTLTALGGVTLAQAIIGTTVVVTTSWLMWLLSYVIYALLLALGAYAGVKLAGAVCDKLSDSAFEGYGTKIGESLGSVRSFFTRKGAAA